jgi:hypothetical protein
MTDKKEMTAPVTSVGADAEQSSQIYITDIILDIFIEINGNILRGGEANG